MENNHKTLIINLFGGPGAGKSTKAARIFADLKEKGYLCELTAEYAKDLVWQESWNVLKNQLYIFGKQHHRIWRLNGKVDIIITDSPFLLSMVYAPDYSTTFKNLVLEEHNNLWTLNIVLKRNHTFEKEGRYHNEEQSLEIDKVAKAVLENYNVPFVEFSTSHDDHVKMMMFIHQYFKMGRLKQDLLASATTGIPSVNAEWAKKNILGIDD